MSKNLNTSPNKKNRGQRRTWKDAQHHESLRKWELKPRDTPTDSLEWLKWKRLTRSSFCKDVEKLELP